MNQAIGERTLWEQGVEQVPVDIASLGSILAVGTSDGDALMLDALTGAVRKRATCDGGLLTLAPSPDRTQLVLAGPFGGWIWHVEQDAPVALNTGDWCAGARWVSDDRWALAQGKRVSVYSGAGVRRWVSDPLPSTVADLAWLGGRHRLAAAVYGGVHVIEPRRNGSSAHLPFQGSLLALAASPHGKWLVSGNQDASLQVFRTDKDTRLEMQGYPAKITRVAFDRSGRWLANNGAPEVSVWDFGGQGPRGRSPVLCVSPESSDQPATFAWHADQARLAIGWRSGTVTSVNVVAGVPGQPSIGDVLTVGLGEITALTWSGDRLIVGCQDGTVLLLGKVAGQ
jgi:WD40 repeat protein